MEIGSLYFSDALDDDDDLPVGTAGVTSAASAAIRGYLSDRDRLALIGHLRKFTPGAAVKPPPLGDRSVVAEVIGRVVLDLGQTHRAMLREGFTTSTDSMQKTIDTLVGYLVSGGEGESWK